MSAVDVDAVMASLKGFQRGAVDHVIDRFYGAGSAAASGRFLIADETGLGKSIVAKGVIARAIEHLEHDESVDRIDVVYVCSNVDLARQNLRRLNVTGDEHIGVTTRLTLLAKESRRLTEAANGGGKKVNLVSFTPGTSFSEGGWRQGSAPERAMLTVILDGLVNRTHSDRRSTRLLLQGMVTDWQRFDAWYVRPLVRELKGEPDPRIVEAFAGLIRDSGALERFMQLRDAVRGRKKVPGELWHPTQVLIAEMRQALAKAGVDTLEPDLIILDEFQRFRHLLDPSSGDAAELAHALFDHGKAKVLLLSATPYKPFTNHDDAEDDHYADFLATIRFLAGGDRAVEAGVAEALADYRRALVTGGEADAAAARVRSVLLPLMSRSERPPISVREDLVDVRHLPTAAPEVSDIREWSALRALGESVGAPVHLEYWKSTPYFVNYMDGYKAGGSIKAQRDSERAPLVAEALAQARSLSREQIEAFAPIDLGNGHLRALAEQTVHAGWWKLLWVPPTMPYLEPGPIYAPLSDGSVTKQVIFSAWTSVPTSVATLLSYEADRLAAGDLSLLRENTPDGRKAVGARLPYRLDEGRAASMSTLALFWPHPGLASFGDQLKAARAAGGLVDPAAFVSSIAERMPEGDQAERAWEAYFSAPGHLPAGLLGEDADALIAEGAPQRGTEGLVEHIRVALETADAAEDAPRTHPDLARLSAFAPGNIALRALRTVVGEEVSAEGLWRAAFELARGIRTLFNRTESTALLITLYGREKPYWQQVLDYCADGNLRAVLDEYLFQLHSEAGGGPLDDEGLWDLAQRAVDALSLQQAHYEAHDNTLERNRIPLTVRFALRYGGKYATEGDDKGGVRQGEVRTSFNSPFAPFVLASTSVGQEGIDFHWWSHAVVHWNLPSNPVDFEQREGRVNRFAGHAVRKNVAEQHWQDVLASEDASVWRAAFNAAGAAENELGEFSPWWVYPGSARIHRVLAHYPLSRDIARYERLRSDLTLYRLTLGQPRQEDMVDLLAGRGVDGGGVAVIDLRPPGARR